MHHSFLGLVCTSLALVSAKDTSTDAPTHTTTGGGGGNPSNSPPPDVNLHIPELSVDRIELEVSNLEAEVNLAASVASLVEINAGVQVGIENVKITIDDVEAKLDLVVRLGHLAEIVNRTLATLDMNPFLLNLVDTSVDLDGDVVGAVDGRLGTIVDGGTTINFLIDNLGNIVQEVIGGNTGSISTVVGSYKQNMMYTGQEKHLEGGFTQRTYEYSELGAIVNVVTNAADHVVRAYVVKGGGDDDDDDDDDDDGDNRDRGDGDNAEEGNKGHGEEHDSDHASSTESVSLSAATSF